MWQVTMSGRPRYTGPPWAGKTQCLATHEFSTLSREASTESFQLKMLFCTVGLIVNFHLSSFQQNTWFSEVVSRETSIETSESKQGGFDLKFFYCSSTCKLSTEDTFLKWVSRETSMAGLIKFLKYIFAPSFPHPRVAFNDKLCMFLMNNLQMKGSKWPFGACQWSIMSGNQLELPSYRT